MKKSMLFIGSLPTKKSHYNGETNKTGDIYKIFKKTGNLSIKAINLTRFKLFNTFRMVFLSMFLRFDVIFVSKCVVGGTLILHLLNKFSNKHNTKNIYYYLIGNGIDGFEDKKLYLDDLSICKNVIFEADELYSFFSKYNVKNYSVCPCVKQSFNIQWKEKDYSKIEPISCIFFSRICEEKGLMDAVLAIEKVNSILNKKAFTLDIAGAPTTPDAELFQKKLVSYVSGKNEFKFYGKDFCINGPESYYRLQSYDLHLFPTKFKQECVPGSIVDMFIAGVPTLSSSFPNSVNILSCDDSYIFKQGDFNDLVDKLIYIYNHKSELNDKRKRAHNLRIKYDETAFLKLCKKINIL